MIVAPRGGIPFPNGLHHLDPKRHEDLRERFRGVEGNESRDPPRRDLLDAGAERRRQDHAHQHRLRHRQPDAGSGRRRRPRLSSRTRASPRSLVGLVPQELTTDAFETVWDTTMFSRGLFGKAKSPARVEEVLKSLSLWDKKSDKIMTLSGGMKRRVMIAKALAHDPQILFLDEPTAGVDVELRKDMWNVVRGLRDSGVTIILDPGRRNSPTHRTATHARRSSGRLELAVAW